MKYRHIPVLLEECINALNINPEGIYVDGTLGGGGHAAEIYKRLRAKGKLVGIDADITAIEASKKRLADIISNAELIIVNRNFREIKSICEEQGIETINGALLDLGVSSYQFDEGKRGFSYNTDALLDMRMDQKQNTTAEEIVNGYSGEKLKEIIYKYGEEKWAARIVDFIIKERIKKRISTTLQLADIIKAAVPAAARREGPHPARRVFQALRIEVNDEIEALREALDGYIQMLDKGGRLAVITFHSLEDRMVKEKFKTEENPCTCPKEFPVCICKKVPRGHIINSRPIVSSKEELLENPRSRSAKLRIFEKH